MEAMTLQDVREAIALKLVRGRDAGQASLKEWHAVLVAHLHPERATDAHLAQPAQAVDVDYVREVIAEMEIKAPRVMLKHVDSWAERLTRALSGEKAGPVGEPMIFQDLRHWLQHCVSCCDEGEDFALDAKLLTALTTLGLMEKAGRGAWRPTKAGIALAASPTPDKEGEG